MTWGAVVLFGLFGGFFLLFCPCLFQICLLIFRPWISDEFTKNVIYRRGPHQDLYSDFSENHEGLLFTSLTPLWALSPSLFCSAPINFRGSLGTSQVLSRTHFAHTLFFLEHSSPYIHSANFHKTLSARWASSSFIHFQQTPSSFLLWCSSCLEDAVCKLLLKAALFFPQIPPHLLAILPTKKPHLLIFQGPSHWPVLSLVSLWLSILGLQLSAISWRYGESGL